MKQQKSTKGGVEMLISPTQFARQIGIETALARELMKFLEVEPAAVSPQKVRLFYAEDLSLIFEKLQRFKNEILGELKNSTNS